MLVLVDGIWSSWNEWTNCTLDTSGGCGTNDKVFRNRTCTNPEPQIGGNFCPGRHFMTSYLSKCFEFNYLPPQATVTLSNNWGIIKQRDLYLL